MAAGRHLRFLKFQFSTFGSVLTGVVYHRAKFHRDNLSGWGDIEILSFSKWRPSAILNFFKSKFSTLGTVRSGAVHRCTKFHRDSSVVIKYFLFIVLYASGITVK